MKSSSSSSSLLSSIFLLLLTSISITLSLPIPIPKDRYLLSAIQEIAPITTGMGAGFGATASSLLGPEAIPAGTVIGGAAGAALGIAAGATVGALEKATGQPCSDRRSTLPWAAKVFGGGASAGVTSGTWWAVPIGAATTAAAEGGMRLIDPSAGICHVPDDDDDDDHDKYVGTE